ncbi:hypothetical protein Vafri_13762 [Volvox africanus]|uniref:Fe2OG dioxygenase domain-containing protein n=1 Tax=Volvox africanus TaxID=51714 RepID=A0A8J4BDD3_9CHLO|nr:hypothetical protein Vafri_13762 [Volvox africanus]
MKGICKGRTAGCHERPAVVTRRRYAVRYSSLIQAVDLWLAPSSSLPLTTRAIWVASAVEPQTQPLTPRQRRLAQQRRKWEEERQQQQQQRDQPLLKQQQQLQLEHQGACHPQTSPPLPKHTGSTTKGSEITLGNPMTAPFPPTNQVAQILDGGGPTRAATIRSGTSRGVHGISTPGRSTATASNAAARRQSVPSPPQSPPQKQKQRQHQRLLPPHSQQQQHQQDHQHQHQEEQQLAPSEQGHGGGWPRLFSSGEGQPLRADLDLYSLPLSQLISLAHQWAEELVGLEKPQAPRSHVKTSSALALLMCDIMNAGTPSPKAQALPAQAAQSEDQQSNGRLPSQSQLPVEVARRLALLTSAVDAHVTRGSLGHQELADLAWCIGHYDRQHSLRVLHPAMRVPFSVVPRFMPTLRLEDFMSEIELRRDTIYLDDGSRAVEESRMTGWQSEIGATFRYSGKEMQPQPGGLSGQVLKVRDELQVLTGIKYDSVLINYYADGKCGMRYHVDPLYDRWTPNSAVVSLGDTRTFIFREVHDHSTRWQYRVRNGDAVLMFDDCQDRLQHCVRVEKRAEDAGPRMSLVFKERLRGPTGQYLLP